jgi:nucleoside-diphosphate-sugar epimerase
LFVEDVAEAFVALLESRVCGAVNIGSGVPVTIRDLALQIADLINARDLVRFGTRPVAPGEPELLVADVARLATEVGVHPRYTLATGLDTTIRWWKEQLSAGLVAPQVFS